MHFSQVKDVPHKLEYLFGKNGRSWRVFFLVLLRYG